MCCATVGAPSKKQVLAFEYWERPSVLGVETARVVLPCPTSFVREHPSNIPRVPPPPHPPPQTMSLNNTRGGADFQQCGQCYVGLCKKHPGQDSGRGSASLLAGAKAAQQSGQAALYDQLVGKKLERAKAEAAAEKAAAAEAEERRAYEAARLAAEKAAGTRRPVDMDRATGLRPVSDSEGEGRGLRRRRSASRSRSRHHHRRRREERHHSRSRSHHRRRRHSRSRSRSSSRRHRKHHRRSRSRSKSRSPSNTGLPLGKERDATRDATREATRKGDADRKGRGRDRSKSERSRSRSRSRTRDEGRGGDAKG